MWRDVDVVIGVSQFLGPEHLKRKLEVEHDADVRLVADEETIEQAIHRRERMGMGLSDEDLADAAEVRRVEEAERENKAGHNNV